jgi:hypothetical protein
MKRGLIVALVVAFLPEAALAQAHQPYAGLEVGQIKALSAQQVADLKAGRGMGLALAAELNGYPGPSHVLDLAGPLELTDDQRTRVTALFDAMKGEAVPLGEELIAREAALDSLFADRRASPLAILAATAAIGETQGRLRAAHLRYHLSTLEVLMPTQVQRYAELRGYGATPEQHQHQHK